MASKKLRGKHLSKLGYPVGKASNAALHVLQNFKYQISNLTIQNYEQE